MYRIGPISRKSNFHSREKCLIGLVLATLCLFCFGGIFLLPDNFGSDRVLRVYKQFQKAGPEIFIPAPPLAAHAPKDSDPHFVNDRQKLQAKIKEELGELLDKPVIEEQQEDIADSADGGNDIAAAAAAGGSDGGGGGGLDSPFDVEQQQQGAAPPLNGEVPPPPVRARNDDVANLDKNNLPVGNLNLQMPLGGNADADPSVEEKRLKVKEYPSKCRNFEEIPLGGIEKKYFIQGHNGIRNKVALDFNIGNMNLLYWSRELEAMAKRYLHECIIEEPSCRVIGKELLECRMNFSFKERHLLSASWPGRVVRSWYVEVGYQIKDWKSFLKIYYNDPSKLANFTQMIWPLTEFIGCGGARCCTNFCTVLFLWEKH